MSSVKKAITKVVIELIELKAVQRDLERALPYLCTCYYYDRKQQVERRIDELNEILLKAKIGWVKDAPAEQYLVTEG